MHSKVSKAQLVHLPTYKHEIALITHQLERLSELYSYFKAELRSLDCTVPWRKWEPPPYAGAHK